MSSSARCGKCCHYLHNCVECILESFFFNSKITRISLPNRKERTTKPKKSSTQNKLHTIFLNNVNHHRKTNSLPDMRLFLLPCILRKLMSYPVVISFHMLDFPATKRRQQTTNPLIHMTKTANCFSCCDTSNNC